MKLLFTSIAIALLLTACATGEHYMLDDGESIVLNNTTDCLNDDCADPILEPLIDYADPEPTEEQIADANVVEETDALEFEDEAEDSDVEDETGFVFQGPLAQKPHHHFGATPFHPIQTED